MSLVDHLGRPLKPKDDVQKKDLENSLADFMAKHQSNLQAWFNQHGTHVRPPIFYDTDQKKWFWASRQQRRGYV